MGLDMFLYGKRHIWSWAESDRVIAKKVNNLFGFDPTEDQLIENTESAVSTVTFLVAYWRKANAIHGWFVENVQEGTDECQEAYVSREQLGDLLNVVKTVLADRSKAPELLPTKSGFFFGGNQYDEWYFNGLEYTRDRLVAILNPHDERYEHLDFYYQSSW
jgi:hypothetical protein